jgi:hypothetical protein
VFPTTLWLAPTDERVRAIMACVARLGRDDRALLAVQTFDAGVAALATPEGLGDPCT